MWFDVSQPYGPIWPVTGIALPFFMTPHPEHYHPYDSKNMQMNITQYIH
jgi:hypothetical protein